MDIKQFPELIRDRVRVQWVYLGEGWGGEYDPEDPGDEELLRFDVDFLGDSGEWEAVDDASYCTRMPYNTPEEILKQALELIMDEVHEPLMSGYRIKKTCEVLSWIGPDWIKEDKICLPLRNCGRWRSA